MNVVLMARQEAPVREVWIEFQREHEKIYQHNILNNNKMSAEDVSVSAQVFWVLFFFFGGV
jgi:hypothetical protein